MFRRTFWFTTGVAAGVWATTKVNRKLSALTPENLAVQAADRAVLAGRRIKVFALDVRDGMADREAALKDALGLTAAPVNQARELPARQGPVELGPAHPRSTEDPGKIGNPGKEDH